MGENISTDYNCILAEHFSTQIWSILFLNTYFSQKYKSSKTKFTRKITIWVHGKIYENNISFEINFKRFI